MNDYSAMLLSGSDAVIRFAGGNRAGESDGAQQQAERTRGD